MRLCSVEGCDARHEAKGYCNKHYLRLRHQGDPLAADGRGQHMAGRARAKSPSWKGDELSYQGVHKRLERYRGPAKNQMCADCGDEAADWAFDEPHGYSADLSRYQPLCKPCHTKSDR